MAKGYTIPVDLTIDRMGWSSPIVSINEGSPVYGSKVTAVAEVPSSSDELKSPDATIDTRHMPSNVVAVQKPKPTSMENTTTVDTINPCNIVE